MKDTTKESEIEEYLRNKVQRYGGIAYKFSSPQRRSVPDRLCVMPKGKHFFVECKSPTGKLTGGQIREIDRLGGLEHHVHVVHTKAEVDFMLIMEGYHREKLK